MAHHTTLEATDTLTFPHDVSYRYLWCSLPFFLQQVIILFQALNTSNTGSLTVPLLSPWDTLGGSLSSGMSLTFEEFRSLFHILSLKIRVVQVLPCLLLVASLCCFNLRWGSPAGQRRLDLLVYVALHYLVHESDFAFSISVSFFLFCCIFECNLGEMTLYCSVA